MVETIIQTNEPKSNKALWFKMNYRTPTVSNLYLSGTTRPEANHGTTVDETGSETVAVTPEPSSFISTKIPDVVSNGPVMETMLLSFGIITVIGLAVAVVRLGLCLGMSLPNFIPIDLLSIRLQKILWKESSSCLNKELQSLCYNCQTSTWFNKQI